MALFQFKHTVLTTALVFAVSACDEQDEPTATGSQSDTNRIVSLCGAGFSSSVTAGLVAEIDKANTEGEISAEIERALQGVILQNESVTEANLPGIYNSFLACVKEQTGL